MVAVGQTDGTVDQNRLALLKQLRASGGGVWQGLSFLLLAKQGHAYSIIRESSHATSTTSTRHSQLRHARVHPTNPSACLQKSLQQARSNVDRSHEPCDRAANHCQSSRRHSLLLPVRRQTLQLDVQERRLPVDDSPCLLPLPDAGGNRGLESTAESLSLADLE